RLIENDKWVAHTNLVRRDVADLLLQITNAETGQRGYVVTGQDEFLQPYHDARERIDVVYAHVLQLTNDNEAQQTRLKELKPVIDDKIKEMQRVLDARPQGFEAAATIIAAGAGKAMMDKIRSFIAVIDQEEVDLLADRNTKSQTASD